MKNYFFIVALLCFFMIFITEEPLLKATCAIITFICSATHAILSEFKRRRELPITLKIDKEIIDEIIERRTREQN